VWVVVLLPLLLDVVLRMHGRAQVVAAGLLPAWTIMLVTWPLLARPGDPLSANGLLWVAHRHGQPVHWLGENMYVPAVLGTMLLAAWWLRTNRDGPTTMPAANPRQSQNVGEAGQSARGSFTRI
jgi:hypothetical protein